MLTVANLQHTLNSAPHSAPHPPPLTPHPSPLTLHPAPHPPPLTPHPSTLNPSGRVPFAGHPPRLCGALPLPTRRIQVRRHRRRRARSVRAGIGVARRVICSLPAGPFQSIFQGRGAGAARRVTLQRPRGQRRVAPGMRSPPPHAALLAHARRRADARSHCAPQPGAPASCSRRRAGARRQSPTDARPRGASSSVLRAAARGRHHTADGRAGAGGAGAGEGARR